MNGKLSLVFSDFEIAVEGFIKPAAVLRNGSLRGEFAGVTAEEVKLCAQNSILLRIERAASKEVSGKIRQEDGEIRNGIAETKTGSDRRSKSLKQLMNLLEPYLVSDEGPIRRNAMLLLGLVLTRCTTVPVSQHLAERVVEFCAKRLFDWFSVEGAMLVNLGLLEHHLSVLSQGALESPYLRQDKPVASDAESDSDTADAFTAKYVPCPRVILDSVLRHVHAPSFAQPIRKYTLRVLTIILDEFPQHVRALGPKVVTRIFCQVENEKDPRNLMLSFPLMERLLRNYGDLVGHELKEKSDNACQEDVTQRLDMIADVMLSYFPIRFKPAHSNLYNITEEDLQARLSRCFLANRALASRLLDGFLDLLNDSLAAQQADDVADAVDAICSCVEYFQDVSLVQSYIRPFFDVIKLAAWYIICPELPVLASGFARLLAVAAKDAKMASIQHSLQSCCSVLLSVTEDSFAAPPELVTAKCILSEAARASPKLLVAVCNLLLCGDGKKNFLSRIRLSVSEIGQRVQRSGSFAGSSATDSSAARRPGLEKDFRSSSHLWARPIADLEFLKELTIVMRQQLARDVSQLTALKPILKVVYAMLLQFGEAHSDMLIKEYQLGKQASGILLFEIFVNTISCLAVFARSSPAEDAEMCRQAIGCLSTVLGLSVSPSLAPSWACQWQQVLEGSTLISKPQNVNIMSESLIRTLKDDGLVGCSRLLPGLSRSVLWDAVTAILAEHQRRENSTESKADSTENGFLWLHFTIATELAGLWISEPDDNEDEVLHLLHLLFDVAFHALRGDRKAEARPPSVSTDECFAPGAPYSLPSSGAVKCLRLALEALCVGVVSSETLGLFLRAQQEAVCFVSRLLSDEEDGHLVHFVELFVAALSTPLDYGTAASPDDVAHLIDLFEATISSVLNRCDDAQLLTRFLQTLTQGIDTIESSKEAQVAALLIPSVLPRLLMLGIVDESSGTGEVVRRLQNNAGLLACGKPLAAVKASTDGEGVWPSKAVEVVLSAMRKVLVSIIIGGPPPYCKAVIEQVKSATLTAETPGQQLRTAVTRGHVARGLAARPDDRCGDANASRDAASCFLLDLVDECQHPRTAHSFFLFVPALVLRIALSSDSSTFPIPSNRQRVSCDHGDSRDENPQKEARRQSLSRREGYTSARLTVFSNKDTQSRASLLECILNSDSSSAPAVAARKTLMTAWTASSHIPRQRMSVSALIFTLLTRLPIETLGESIAELGFEDELPRILLATLETIPWGQPVLSSSLPARSALPEVLEFQAQVDHISGDITLFLLSLLLNGASKSKKMSSPATATSLSISSSTSTKEHLSRWYVEVLGHAEIALASCLRQASKNSIPSVRDAALRCVYLIGQASKLYPNVLKFKWMVCEGLQAARNDPRHLIRRSAAVCSNYWNILP